jgi:hypothetical protein
VRQAGHLRARERVAGLPGVVHEGQARGMPAGAVVALGGQARPQPRGQRRPRFTTSRPWRARSRGPAPTAVHHVQAVAQPRLDEHERRRRAGARGPTARRAPAAMPMATASPSTSPPGRPRRTTPGSRAGRPRRSAPAPAGSIGWMPARASRNGRDGVTAAAGPTRSRRPPGTLRSAASDRGQHLAGQPSRFRPRVQSSRLPTLLSWPAETAASRLPSVRTVARRAETALKRGRSST